MRNFSYFETKNCQFTDQVPSQIFVINQFIACGFYGVLFCPIVFLNGISIFTISRSSQLKEKVCYFLILQSVVDSVFGLIVLPLLTAYSDRQRHYTRAKRSYMLAVLYDRVLSNGIIVTNVMWIKF